MPSSPAYIPLSQVPPAEWPLKPPPSRLAFLRAYFSSRRAVNALIAATSLITLFGFVRYSLSADRDEFEAIKLGSAADPFTGLGYQRNYIAIPVPDALPPQARPKLCPVRDLPLSCLEQYYVAGELCHDARGPLPFDVVWTWVNGSDPLFSEAKDSIASAYAPDDPYRPRKTNNPLRMFRDHDELRHSLRSVLANFRQYTNNFRILTSDIEYPHDVSASFPDPNPDSGTGYWRLGLLPQWLETSQSGTTEWRDGDVRLSITHHAHFFEPYNRSIFNSYAIESQFGHLQDLSESFIYFNDDFFMVAPLTPASFYTHHYGTVLRMQPDLKVSPNQPAPNTVGEWKSMGHTNFLLSKRFGRRSRPYVAHLAKAVSYALLQEIGLVWPTDLASTGAHAFRETEGGDGDFYQLFAHHHFLVERAREALLWAWAVGRVGGVRDQWGKGEEERAWRELGGEKGGAEVRVRSGVRETVERERVGRNLEASGVGGTVVTSYDFSSLDGFAYNKYGWRGAHGWPGFAAGDDPSGRDDLKAKDEVRRRVCTIKRDECFAAAVDPEGGATLASEVFKHIAFARPECGDCIITALVRASGPTGLSAFLPPAERRAPGPSSPPANSGTGTDADADAGAVPHLPLVADWRDGRFALADVMAAAGAAPGESVRVFAMRVMQRYRYVIGGTPSAFEPLKDAAQTRGMLARLDRNKDLALLCVNDELNRDHERADKVFREWQERRWGEAAAWEADAPSYREREREREKVGGS